MTRQFLLNRNRIERAAGSGSAKNELGSTVPDTDSPTLGLKRSNRAEGSVFLVKYIQAIKILQFKKLRCHHLLNKIMTCHPLVIKYVDKNRPLTRQVFYPPK